MNSVISKFINVWLHPWKAMASVKEEGEATGIAPSIIFIVVMGILSGLITALMAMVFPPPPVAAGEVPRAFSWLAVIIYPLGSFLGSFIGAFVLWGMIFGLLKGTGPQYKSTYRLSALLAAFSPVVALLSPIPTAGPILAFAVNVWALIVLIRGIILAMETPPVRTWVILAVIFGLLLGFSLAARFTAEQQFGGGLGGPTDDLGDFGEGLDLDEEALNEELENLADEQNQN